jgi:hypothetical protein
MSSRVFTEAPEGHKTVWEMPSAGMQGHRSESAWSPGRFGREQIRGLIRRVFSATGTPAIRQVAFSAIDPETDVRRICMQVAEELALETERAIAVVGGHPMAAHMADPAGRNATDKIRNPIFRDSVQVQDNLWWLPAAQDVYRASTASLHSYLAEIRREFEYSIVETPCSGSSNEAVSMAQFADGMILIVSAQHTRRAAARRTKEAFDAAHVRTLGIVLSDREFPIPEGIYRRL